MPKGGIVYKVKNKVQSFVAMRNMENEFVDFKTYQMHDQFKEVYVDLFNAFRRSDKVILNRSLSQSMYEVSFKLFPYFYSTQLP